jgi:DNA-binding IclR family transcriptional regulator
MRRVSVGTVIPILASAAGLVYLTFSDERTSENLLAVALSSEPLLLRAEALDIPTVRKSIADSARRGYCVYQGSSYRGISVPVYRGTDLFAALTMRSSADDPWPEKNDDLYFPILREIADSLQLVLE